MSPHARALDDAIKTAQPHPYIRDAFEKMANTQETRFIIPPTPIADFKKKLKRNQKSNHISFGCVNIRSVYGREQTLMRHMVSNDITYTAVTEPMLRQGDPPVKPPESHTGSGGGEGQKRSLVGPKPRSR